MSDALNFIIGLTDRVSAPAKASADSLTKLDASLKKVQVTSASTDKAIEKETANLAKLQKQMASIQSGTEVNVGQYKKLQTAIDKSSGSLATLQAKSAGAKKASAELTAAKTLEEKAARASFDSNASLSQAFAGLAGPAAAAGAAVAAVGAGLYKGATFAESAVQLKDDTLNALETATGTAESAQRTYDTIVNISKTNIGSEEKAQKLGLTLADAKVPLAQLGDTIKAITSLEKVRGEAAGSKLESLLKKTAASGAFKLNSKQLAGTGIAEQDVIDALAKTTGRAPAIIKKDLEKGKITAEQGIKAITQAINAKIGDKALAQFEDVDNTIQKLKDNFGHLFEGVNVSGFNKAFATIPALFDSSTASGKVMKGVIETILNKVFQLAEAAIPFVKVAIKQVEIGALKLYLAFLPAILAIQKAFGDDSKGALESFATGLGYVIKYMVFFAGIEEKVIRFTIWWWQVFAPVREILGEVLDIGVALFSFFADGFDKQIDQIKLIPTYLAGIVDAIAALFTGGEGIAGSLIDGLVAGITGGASKVVDALTNVGQSAIDAVKNVLDSHSPSRVMEGVGLDTTDGFVGGVEKGTPDTSAALSAAVSPPDAGGGGGGSAGGGSGGGINVNVGGVTVAFGGAAPKNAEELTKLLPELMTKLWEEMALQIGGAVGGKQSPSGAT